MPGTFVGGVPHGQTGTHAEAFRSPLQEADRWAEAFHRNVLSHHQPPQSTAAPVSDPQPSRRPTPHSGTKTTTTFVAPASHQDSAAQWHSGYSRTSNGGNSVVSLVAPPPPPPSVRMAATSRPVAAVGVHPPLSRSSMRAALKASATASRSGSSPTPSSPMSVHSAAGAVAGQQTPHVPSTLPSSSSEPPLHRSSSSSGASATAALPPSATATPKRSASQQLPANGMHHQQQPLLYSAPHMRTSVSSSHPHYQHQQSHSATKPLVHLQLTSQRSASASAAVAAAAAAAMNSPLASAATPHISDTYASSPFFQRVQAGEAAVISDASLPTQGPGEKVDLEEQKQNNAMILTDRTPNDAQAYADEDEADSVLLQEVTPITHNGGGGRSQQDSQLLSQSGDASMQAEATTSEAPFERVSTGTKPMAMQCEAHAVAVDPSLSSYAYTRAAPPHGLPPQLPPPSSTQQTPSSYAAYYPTVAAAAGHGQCSWGESNSDPHGAGSLLAQQQQMPVYYPPGYNTVPSYHASQHAMSGGPTMCSPYTPGDTTRLSGTPGGLSGSHSTTMNSTAYQRSSVLLPMMTSASGSNSVAASFLQPMSRHVCPTTGDGLSPYYTTPQNMSEMMPHGASPLSPSPSSAAQYYHYQCGGSGYPSHSHSPLVRGAGYVPTVSGTAATTTATIAASQHVTSGLAGVALEKQLLHATKEELVQILLELGSCNPEASRFIDAKAFLFAFRHEHRTSDLGATANVATAVASTHGHGAATEQTDCGVGARASGAVAAQTAKRSDLSSTVSLPDENARGSNPSIARCIFPAEAAEGDCVGGDEEKNRPDSRSPAPSGTTASSPPPSDSAPAPSAAAIPKPAPLPERRVRPEERAFSADVHPCMRWYGACRNTTSCIYAAVPRNLCLNWIRGSCVAHSECSGVHRLPEPCPPELERIYWLNHGVARSDACRAACAATALPPPAPSMQQQQRQRMPGTSSVDHEMRWPCQRSVEGGYTAVAARVGIEHTNTDTAAVHTPHDQSIHKDALVAGGSTPHRHSKREAADTRFATAHAESNGGCKDAVQVPATVSPWTAMDAPIDREGEGLSAEELTASCCFAATTCLPDRHLSSAVSPADSSCSTLEDCTFGPVSRCLKQHFDDAITPTPSEAAAAGTAAGPAALEGCSAVVGGHCNGRSSPVLLPVCEATAPLQVVPLRSVAAAVEGQAQEEDEDDYTSFSAPAAGTRTRMQSPMYR